jgi:D-alanine-D-alanine ligase
MGKKGKIVILHSDVVPDASEDELDCLRQADTIAGALQQLGYDPVLMPFVLDLDQTINALNSLRPDLVFNLVETVASKGNLIYFAPALLDHLQIPYTGSGTEAIFLTSNKPLAKKIMYEAGIPTPAWISKSGINFGLALTETYIVKASWEHASVGLDDDSIITFADTAKLLAEMEDRRKKIGSEFFAEAYIDGREFNIALITGPAGELKVLPPAEMLFLDYAPDKLKLLDYRAKWVEDSFEYNNTRRTMDFRPEDAFLISQLQDIAKNCWHLFGLRGYARVDFRVDKDGNPWVLEINANPCLSLEAGFAAAIELAAIKYHEAIECIVNDAYR